MNILSDELIKKLYKIANSNPRRLLQRGDKACRHVIESGDREFTEEHFKKLFGEVKEEKSLEKETPKKKTTKKKTPKAPKKSSKKEENDENLFEVDED